MSDQPASKTVSNDSPASVAPALGKAAISWMIPGAGHWLLGHKRRAVFYLAVIVATVLAGIYLHGRIEANAPGQPLAGLTTLGTMGLGLVYFALKWSGYQGDLLAQGYEYGSAFLISAGVMNWLLVLDVWDTSLGRKG